MHFTKAMMALYKMDQFLRGHPLTRGNPSAAWRRYVNWQVKSRLSKSVRYTWLNDLQVFAEHGMTGFTGNIYAGLHEAVDMLFVLHFLRPDDLFADVGANVGSYTLLASGVTGAHSAAFEPDPISLERLRRNLFVNGLQSKVSVYAAAVGAEAGEVQFTVGEDTVNRVVDDADCENTRVVPLVTLDATLGLVTPAMIKFDVEGYEDEALRGAEALMARPTLKVIALETLTEKTAKLLKSHGFLPFYYDPFSRTLSEAPGADRSANQLFVRDISYVCRRVADAPAVKVLGMSI